MSWFTKRVTILNQELNALESLVHQVGMKFDVLQRIKIDARENIQGADDALTKALKLISNAEDSLGIASAYISKYKQYYKSEEARKFWEEDDTSTTLSDSESDSAFAEIEARVSDLEKRVRRAVRYVDGDEVDCGEVGCEEVRGMRIRRCGIGNVMD